MSPEKRIITYTLEEQENEVQDPTKMICHVGFNIVGI